MSLYTIWGDWIFDDDIVIGIVGAATVLVFTLPALQWSEQRCGSVEMGALLIRTARALK